MSLPLQFTWHTRCDELKGQWEYCFAGDRAMRGWELQKVIEASRLSNAEHYHLEVHDEEGLAALLPCCVVTISLVTVANPSIQKFIEGIRKIFPKFLYTRMFFVGSAFSSSKDLIGIPDTQNAARWTSAKVRAIFAEIIQKAKSVKTSFVIVKELETPLKDFLKARLNSSRFFFPEGLPTAYLSVASLARGGYVESIRTKYRNKLKKRKQTAADSGLYWRAAATDEGQLERMYDLHSQVMQHAEVVFEHLNLEFLGQAKQWMQEDPTQKTFYSMGFQKMPDGTEKLICSEFVMGHGDTLWPLYTGFDYSIKQGSDLYFNAYYALIAQAEARGYARIHLGQTAYEVKAELGCTFEPLFLGVHHRNPVVHKILDIFQKIFFDTVKVPQRDVFATPPTPPKNQRKDQPKTQSDTQAQTQPKAQQVQ